VFWGLLSLAYRDGDSTNPSGKIPGANLSKSGVATEPQPLSTRPRFPFATLRTERQSLRFVYFFGTHLPRQLQDDALRIGIGHVVRNQPP
jgi:hypothetical protein